MPPEDHLSEAQGWLKSSGHSLKSAKHAIAEGKCVPGLTFLTTAARRLGVAQGHLGSVSDAEPRAASRKIAMNRAFSGLKNAVNSTLDQYRCACSTEARPRTTRVVCKNKLTDY
jgi:hypothetical protein